jgi:hypothetical protein
MRPPPDAILSPVVESLLCEMASDPRPLYAHYARAAFAALERGELVGAVTTSDRDRLRRALPGIEPAAAACGALFQHALLRDPPLDERDLPGWVVVEDDFRGGLVVLVHELAHFRNRWPVWRAAAASVPCVDSALTRGPGAGQLGWVRAQFLNEVAARHTAYLAEEGSTPARVPLPARGAFFECAVKIASYPHVYNDTGPMQRLVARGDDGLLRDQVAAWFDGLRSFLFFEPGGDDDRAHRRWLDDEIAHASLGRRAPRVAAEGTL